MQWQLSLLLFYATSVLQALLQRSYSQKSKLPHSFPPALSYLIGVTPLGIILGLLLQHSIHWSWWLGLLLLIEGIFIGLYNWISFKAIAKLPIAQFLTIYQTYEIVVIVLGWSLLSEKLSVPQVFGALLLLGAAILATRAPRSQEHKQATLYAMGLALLSAVVMGIGLVAEKAALQYMDTGAYFIFGYSMQTIILLGLASKDMTRESIKKITVGDLKRILAMGVLSATVGFFYIFAIVDSNNISLITALAAFTLPLSVLGGYIFLRERENARLLWAATALGCLGLLISAL